MDTRLSHSLRTVSHQLQHFTPTATPWHSWAGACHPHLAGEEPGTQQQSHLPHVTEGGLGRERVHHPKLFSRLHLAGFWAKPSRAYDWVSDEVGPQATSLHGIGGIGDEEKTGVGKNEPMCGPHLCISQPQLPPRTFQPVLSAVKVKPA